MSEAVNEQDLMEYIVSKTKADPKAIEIVLNHETAFMNKAKPNAKGEIDIDLDDLVDYIMSKPNVKLDEMTVETILDAEMAYLMDKGEAGYLD
ncbi:hypothetical protein NV379_09120 [Paenibacillus sp. N1-5-1-14]|uniref:hypothetical protein n=1 Tax=Paenibacillus radicibacter TaxID=2972488 RepID=UPI002159369F|nr:hypothetical protein [Paenibacillus radicibacter]MCR8642821.1 hypothetical protein [Paenibacillus radicibacter]